ncbi:MAG: DUF1302 domain-containing protein [Gammaproteobacteria bacterium]|nr:MAG: DUF1302 domain-containing protein [Gammaproteobacteria bacterium]
MTNHASRSMPRALRRAVAVALAAAAGAPGAALALDFTAGDWDISLNTTLSWGQLYRVEHPDPRLVGTADGGSGRSPNIDDGNLNYDTGLVSNAFKAVSELAFDRGNYGLFVRGSALYDYEVEEQPTERTPISESGRNLAGSYVRLLDAFAHGRWDLNGHELGVRAGRQVVNWGESTFIQGGINNAINHFDVSALRVPGSEVREAYLPQEMFQVSYALTENLSAEAIAIFDWDRTEPEPVGSFFAANDFVPRGGSQVFLGFGAFSDQGVDFRPLGGPLIPDFQAVGRGPTEEPSDTGQWGVALRWFLPGFSQGTELGFYFVNYHSKLPLISGRTGTQAGLANSLGTLTAAIATAQGLAAGLPLGTAVAIAANAGANTAAGAGGNLSLATAAQYATIAGNTVLGGGNITAQATNLATHEYAKTASYFTQYPEDIRMFGLSFNTQVGTTGIALQGEVSWRQDVPLQFDDVELLFAALTPFEAAALAAQGVTPPPVCTAALPTIARCGQLGSFGLNQVVQGWDVFDVWQAQVTATKAFPPMLGAAQVISVIEAGVTHVGDFPDKLSGGPNGRGLRFNGPGTSVSGNDLLASRHFGEVEPQNRFADATSWGYRLALRFDYLGLVGPWNLSPRLVWSHDVSGTTPGPGGNFVDGRYGITLGVGASLQATWEADVSYTKFGGADRYNELGDRDFVAATIKYSF